MTARQRRLLARIEADLEAEDPDLARSLSRMSRPRGGGARVAVAVVVGVVLVGVVLLIVGAVLVVLPLLVAGLFATALGPLVTVLVIRTVAGRRRWAGSTGSADA